MAARAVVLVNAEHTTAWNVRKRWLLRQPPARRAVRAQLPVFQPFQRPPGRRWFPFNRAQPVIEAVGVHRARPRQAVAATELKLTEAALHRMPKALGAWAHRRCVALP